MLVMSRSCDKPSMKNPSIPTRHGFSLVELLVVIVIVAVLAALSVMGLSRMRSAGDRATTVSVLRQLQIANTSYAHDHGGQYVPLSSMDENQNRINDWHQSSVFLAYLTGDQSALEKNTPVTSVVPTSILDPIVVRAKQRLWTRLFASYGYNREGMPALSAGKDQSFKIAQVTNPTRTAAFITATDWIVVHKSRFLWQANPVEGKSTDQRIAYRHGNKAVVAYYDGSTGFVTPGDLRAFDAKGGASHPFWKANH
jgi:prepilin-type N-terminal cleavage/methylation domain-containing protein/prepilin-type processing-associated H-X9-DG protein